MNSRDHGNCVHCVKFWDFGGFRVSEALFRKETA